MKTLQGIMSLSFEEARKRYHSDLGQRASQAMDEKAALGGWVGQAPTGYVNVRKGRETQVEIDPAVGPLIAEAFQLAARKQSSLRQILAELTPRGLLSRNCTPMNAAALGGILSNPFYAGMVRYKGELYPGSHQALVSPSLFERAGRSLRRRRRSYVLPASRSNTM